MTHLTTFHVLMFLGIARFAAAPDLTEILDRVTARVQANYDTLINITYNEKIVRQTVDRNRKPKGRRQEFTYTVVMSREGQGMQVKYSRQASGRGNARVKANACTDPGQSGPEPLTFLNAENRSKQRFTDAGQTVLDGIPALLLTYVPSVPETPVLRVSNRCFSFRTQSKGKIWIDPSTYNVIQVETELYAPIVFPPMKGLNRRKIELRELRTKIRFRLFTFSDPQQTVLLPEFSEGEMSLGSTENRRITTQAFSNYKRFVADVLLK